MKLKKYRIVTSRYTGYECQKWRLWFPFWIQIGNTYSTIDGAKQFIKFISFEKKVVVSDDELNELNLNEIRDGKLRKLGIK